MSKKHNHFTREIKSRGLCPACDEYRRNHPSASTSSSFAPSSHDDSFSDTFLQTFLMESAMGMFDSSPSFDYGSSSSFDSGSSFDGSGGSF